MLNINDFLLYMPMKGNITDYSRNAYSGSNTGASLTTGKEGISNTAYDFADTTDRISFASSVGNAIATQMNTAITILFNLYGKSITSTSKIIFSQWDTTGGDRSWFMTYINSGATVNRHRLLWINDFDGIVSADNAYVPNTWQNVVYTTLDNTTDLDIELFIDGASVATANDTYLDVLSSTDELRIGADNSNSSGDFGKMSNLIVMNRVCSKLDMKYINKFGNRKRVA